MLNKSAATDARHSRSGKDAMLYNSRKHQNRRFSVCNSIDNRIKQLTIKNYDFGNVYGNSYGSINLKLSVLAKRRIFVVIK